MKYRGSDNFEHGQPGRLGVLITNLGTPEAPQRRPLKKYLRQFLSDPRVVEIPRLLWWLILHGIILNIRPAKSAKAYRTIWTEQGSPLLVTTAEQAAALNEALEKRYGDRVVVAFAMRYGEPSITATLERMFQQGVRQLVVLPLYPQYSCAVTASTFDALGEDFRQRRWLPELHFISHYHDNPGYIDALANKVKTHWQTHGRTEKLMLSFHGEPLRYLHQGDPYFCECHKTSRLLAERLGLSEDDYLTTFQSRFGREPWLQPYTDETLEQWAAQGVKSVQVMCPGFSADCLETLEEIAELNRELFIDAGGQEFQYISCLNADAEHIQLMLQLVTPTLDNWPEKDLSQAAPRARELGASR